MTLNMHIDLYTLTNSIVIILFVLRAKQYWNDCRDMVSSVETNENLNYIFFSITFDISNIKVCDLFEIRIFLQLF